MKLLILLLFMTSYIQSSFAATDLLKLPHTTKTLPNGLKIYLVKYPSPGVVAYQLAVHAGSRNEIEPGKTGFAHFFEHLMFRGTKKRSAKEFGDLYVRLGCENNAWTSNDMTNYHGVVASVYLPQILDAEADRFQNLFFDEKALKDEAGAVLGEYNKDVAQPEFVMEEKTMSVAFTKHTYAHTTMGYKEDVLKFTERYEDVWPFFKRYYRPSNVSIVLVGDLDFAKSIKLIESKFGGWKNPDLKPVEIPLEPEQKEARLVSIKLEKPTQTRVSVGYKVPAFSTNTKDSATLAILSEMYFSVTSDFQKEFRFEKKWIDAVSVGSGDTVDPGLWSIGVRLSASGEGKEKALQQAIENTLKAIEKNGPTELRLAATKKRFLSSALNGWFENPEALASRIAWYTNFEPDFEVLNRVFDRISEVSAQDVRTFVSKYLQDARKTVSILKGSAQ